MLLNEIFFLDFNGIILLSLFFLILAAIIFFVKKLTFEKKDFVKIVSGCLLFFFLTLVFYSKSFNGEGIMYHYGLPHYFYSIWVSFDKTTKSTGYNIVYAMANFVFYFSLLSFILILLKKTKK
jgi:hypothetical protein